jgi:5-methylcytosine-specific restriction protein A
MPAWSHDGRTRHQRGYDYAWVKRRARILKRDGYRCRCQDCTRTGDLKPATQVDHVISKAAWLKRFGNLDRVDDDTNLQAINSGCHDRKTAREMGASVRGGADVNGLPLDPAHPWNTAGGGG